MTRSRRDHTPAPDPPRSRSPFEVLREKVRPTESESATPPLAASGAPESAKEAPRGRVRVRIQRSGHGGKTVTIAEGIELDERELARMAREVATALGLGARVEDGSLVVQGDQRERLASWLRARGCGEVAFGN